MAGVSAPSPAPVERRRPRVIVRPKRDPEDSTQQGMFDTNRRGQALTHPTRPSEWSVAKGSPQIHWVHYDRPASVIERRRAMECRVGGHPTPSASPSAAANTRTTRTVYAIHAISSVPFEHWDSFPAIRLTSTTYARCQSLKPRETLKT
jgi:hypothetical protein